MGGYNFNCHITEKGLFMVTDSHVIFVSDNISETTPETHGCYRRGDGLTNGAISDDIE